MLEEGILVQSKNTMKLTVKCARLKMAEVSVACVVTVVSQQEAAELQIQADHDLSRIIQNFNADRRNGTIYPGSGQWVPDRSNQVK